MTGRKTDIHTDRTGIGRGKGMEKVRKALSGREGEREKLQYTCGGRLWSGGGVSGWMGGVREREGVRIVKAEEGSDSLYA